jgi:hypothetical protein
MTPRAAALLAALGAAVLGVRAPSVAAQGTQATVRLASQTAWVGPGDDFDLRLQIAGVPEPERVDVVVAVHARVTSRSQFALTTEGRALGSSIATTSARLASLLPTDVAGAILVRLGPPGLSLTRTGVYPVEVLVRERGGPVLDRLVTHLIFVAADDAPRLRVALVVPVHAPVALGADAGLPAAATRGLAVLADTLASPAVAGVAFTLAPTPETLDALARSRREGDRAILDALRSAAAGRQVLARPYVPLDVAALERSGLGRLVPDAVRTGVAVTADVLGVRPDPRTWLADGGLDAAGLDTLRDLLVDRLVVPEAALTPVPLQVTLAAPFLLEGNRGARVEAVMADRGLAAHFRNSGDRVLAAHHLLADLATIWMDAPRRTRGVVVLPPRSWVPSRPFLEAALSGLAASPVLEAVSLEQLFTGVPPATGGRAGRLVRHLAPSRDRALPAAALASAARRVAATQTILPPASPTREHLARRLLTAVSADLGSRRARTLAEAADAAARAVAARIVAPPRRTVTLTAREGEIPLTFQNLGPEPLTVAVRLKSDRLTFPDGAQFTLELPPRNHTVRVAVEARTAGLSPLDVVVTDPAGDLQLAASRLEIRSTAASGVGIVLSVGAAVFLAAWWARHLARGRRARRLVPAT